MKRTRERNQRNMVVFLVTVGFIIQCCWTHGQAPSRRDASAESTTTGTLSGIIKFKGTPPKFPPLVKKGDKKSKAAAVCAAQDIPNESLLLGKDGGLANVFVYLLKAPQGATIRPVSEKPLVLDRKGCRYFPHAMLARVGQKILITNSDPINHCPIIAPTRNSFYRAIIPAGERGEYVYERPEPWPVPVTCAVHGWMKAWQLSLDHGFAAVSDEKGEFTIKGLPPGEHVFRIWQERAGLLDRKYKVEIKANETTKVSFAYDAERFER